MKPPKEPPELTLLEAMLFGSEGAITAQEKRGQSDLVNSTSLPAKMNSGTWEQLRQMGVTPLEEPRTSSDLFVECSLPDGWKLVPTDHSMWSNLVDAQGRKRASIFYKAAFYDRDAFMSLTRRFSYQVQPVGGWEGEYKKREWHCVVTDDDKIVWESAERVEPEPDYKDRDAWMDWKNRKETLNDLGKQWLDEHYPNWQDVTAYWDT